MSYVSEVYQALEKKHSNEAEFLEAAKRIFRVFGAYCGSQ